MCRTCRAGAHKPTSLRGIANKAKADKRHRFRDLYRCLDAELLLDCWQDLNKEAASGVDHVTADAYAANLQGNLAALVQRLHTQRSRATLVRRCVIPKANGTDRPLGMPALAGGLFGGMGTGVNDRSSCPRSVTTRR